MVLNTLLVDSEGSFGQQLRNLLKKYENIQVVGETATTDEALQLVSFFDYSIIFLTLNTENTNDYIKLFKVITESGVSLPFIIFLVDQKNFLPDVFSLNTIEYLSRPVREECLDKTLKKIFRLKNTGNINKSNKTSCMQYSGLLPVERKGKIILLEDKDIVYIYANGDYTFIKSAYEKYLTRFTLKELSLRLDPCLFFRCHRSYLVNIKKIKEIFTLENGTLMLTMEEVENGKVPVSRSRTQFIRKLVGI